MRLGAVRNLNCFEACTSCPLQKEGYDDAGSVVKHDVGVLINSMKKFHPGVIEQNLFPPEKVHEFIDKDDEEIGRFVVAAWHCVRIKQRHECENAAIRDVQTLEEYL